MSSFASILNRDYEWFITLKLGWSFKGSFLQSISSSSRSIDFPFDQNSISSKYPNLIGQTTMRRLTLWFISVICASNSTNLSFAGSWGLLIYFSACWSFMTFVLVYIYLFQILTIYAKKLSLILILSINYCGYFTVQFITIYLLKYIRKYEIYTMRINFSLHFPIHLLVLIVYACEI